MRHRPTALVSPFLVAVLVLVLGACSGDGDAGEPDRGGASGVDSPDASNGAGDAGGGNGGNGGSNASGDPGSGNGAGAPGALDLAGVWRLDADRMIEHEESVSGSPMPEHMKASLRGTLDGAYEFEGERYEIERHVGERMSVETGTWTLEPEASGTAWTLEFRSDEGDVHRDRLTLPGPDRLRLDQGGDRVVFLYRQ